MFRFLCAGALSLAFVGQAAAQTQVPTSPGQHGLFDFGSSTPGSEGFLTKQMLDSELGSYVTGTALTAALASYLTQSQAASTYLPLSGGTITGPISGGYYMPQCYTVAALKALPAPSTVGYSCYYDPNNSNEPNIAVFALGAWRYLSLGPAL